MTDHAAIEAMLLRWSDNQNGRTVTFLLPDDGEHPFRGLACGPANGQRLALSVALIADDESQHPVAPAQEVPAQPRPLSAPNATREAGGVRRSWNEMSYSQQAGVLCGDQAFNAFIRERYPKPHGGDIDVESVVRRLCGVASRKDILPGTEAERKWRELVSEFRAWERLPEVVG